MLILSWSWVDVNNLQIRVIIIIIIIIIVTTTTIIIVIIIIIIIQKWSTNLSFGNYFEEIEKLIPILLKTWRLEKKNLCNSSAKSVKTKNKLFDKYKKCANLAKKEETTNYTISCYSIIIL